MAFDEELAARVRTALGRTRGVTEKKMFGGLGFLLQGNMLIGVWKEWLIARLGPEQAEDALVEAHVKVFDITGKAMAGWVMVASAGVQEADDVKSWVQRALKFVRKLPAK
ncbi:MAG: TfoX/Sxy family protein [Gemmataceae bacterium]